MSGYPPRHDPTGLGLRVLAASDLRTDRNDPAVPGAALLDLDTDGLGAQAERFLSPRASGTFALQRRVYRTRGADVRALEYRSGLRYWFFERSPVQLFVTGAVTVAAADSELVDGLSWGAGAALGGGIAAFPSRRLGFEAALLYEGLLLDPRIADTANGTEFRHEEGIYGWTLELGAAVWF